MKFGSLFAGIGGFDLGLERAGMTCAWQVEIDDYCNKVLAKHWPEVKRYRDVREVGKHNLEPVELICGGFPCQPHSVAGKRRGAADDRNLWPEYLRIIREVRPTWVVGENVPGIITTMLDDVLSDLEGEGYTTTTFNIPACGVGAYHIRHRIIIVSHSNGSKHIKQEQSRRGKFSQQLDRIDLRKISDFRNPSEFLRSDDGVPFRVDRLKCLGNAVVPQVAEYIGRCIIEAEE